MKKLVLILSLLLVLASCGTWDNSKKWQDGDILYRLRDMHAGSISHAIWIQFLGHAPESMEKLCNHIQTPEGMDEWQAEAKCYLDASKENFMFYFKIAKEWPLVDKELADKYICGDNNYFWVLDSKEKISNLSCGQWDNSETWKKIDKERLEKTLKDLNMPMPEDAE